MHLRPTRRFLAVAAALAALPYSLTAQEEPGRGGVFEFGAVLGTATFQDKSDIDGCTWVGVRVGHRFAPFPGLERVEFGFRAGWEGCRTTHAEVGKVDIIYLSMAWLTGLRLSPEWSIYWQTGVGESLADLTPGPVRDIKTRFSVSVGPGVTWKVGKHLMLDFSVTHIIHDSFNLGADPPTGTTFGLVPSLMFGLQL